MPDNVAQIASITSEALQAEIRRLLPSQQGFGHDLQASNVIVPVVDLTPTAEGSSLREDLQRALTFADITAFDVENTTTTLMNSAGFWLIELNASTFQDEACRLDITDGFATKQLWRIGTSSAVTTTIAPFEYYKAVILLSSGDSVSATCGFNARLAGNYRQIADVNGNLVNPDGYTPQ